MSRTEELVWIWLDTVEMSLDPEAPEIANSDREAMVKCLERDDIEEFDYYKLENDMILRVVIGSDVDDSYLDVALR